MDFKHNFKKGDIFNIFDPKPPKMTNVIFFFFNEGFPYDLLLDQFPIRQKIFVKENVVIGH